MYYENFEKLCIANGIKPGTVSKATGISTATLTSWKQGKYTPKSDKLQIIADYFNVSLDYLMNGEEKDTTEPYYLNDDARDMAQFMFENPEYKVLFDASRKVKKEDIQFVKEMIDRMSTRD